MQLVLLAASLTLQTAAPETPQFVERPCHEIGLSAPARCGFVRVPENRTLRGGRSLDLNVVVLPATSDAPDLPPLFDIDGGPGLPDVKNAGFYLSVGGAYRARRDIVLVDQRGTGRSNPLVCPELAAPDQAFVPMLQPDAVERCREALQGRADLTQYGTDQAVADLDAVRTALDHPRIDIFALSYGTTVALRYMAEHPGRVRAAVLMGAAPPEAMPPRHHATAGQRALDLLLLDCAADPACRSAWPDPAADLVRARTTLETAPDAPTWEVFMERLRSLMYQPSGARRIPWIVSRAADSDLEPFYAATRPQGPSLIADGVFLSVTCAESFGLMDYEAAALAARETVFGDYRLRRQRDACAVWPAGDAAPEHLQPPRSDASVLLISGRLDPVTPPDWAAMVASWFANSRHLVIPDGGHLHDGLSNIGCLDTLMVRFLEDANPGAVDATCIAEMAPAPFATGSLP